MSHVHEPPTVIREETTSDGGSGLGMVVGVILVVVLAMAMFWFVAGARIFGNGVNPNTGTNQGQNPTINVAPPSINIDKPNVEVNPPAQAPANPAPSAP